MFSPDPEPFIQPIARPAFSNLEPDHNEGPKKGPLSRAENRFRIEGLRGIATRHSVALRYVGYWLIIVISSALVQAAFQGIQGAETGGLWLALSAGYQCVVAAIGTVFLAPHRPEIIDQLRAYVFGYTVLPAVGVSGFMWFAARMAEHASSEDVFLSTLVTALPFLFFLPVIIPAVVFTKMVAGYRVVSRISMDDEEILRIHTRNDGLQR